MTRLAGNFSLAAALALGVGTATTGSALAQGGEEGLTYQVEFADGTLRMKERAGGKLLLEEPEKQFAVSRINGSLSPQVDVSITADGYDVHYTFTNSTSSAKPLPDLRVGPILLGDHVKYQDSRRSCEAVETDSANHRTPGHNYPVNMYSPIWIVRSQDHAAGVSLQYPIMDYRHDVKFFMRYHQRSGGWLVDMRLSSEDGALEYPALVPAGATWEYTVSVRMTPEAEEWVRTLVPYRDFFRSKYGGVQYSRSTGAINAVGLSLESEISDANPYGFSRDDMRPDEVGFGPFVDFTLAREGWPEYMIITPTGLMRRNVHLNYPFKFTTQWTDDPSLESAVDPAVGFQRIPATGKDMGLWWGRSAQVSYQWDTSESYQLDPSNPDHVNAAFAELDKAVQVGATTIGLDTFGFRAIPTWDGYTWLGMMEDRYPGLKFVLEPMPCDIMHTRAAGWLRGFNDGQPVEDLDELNFIKGPHYLADFLLPGHETWAAWRYKGHRLYLGITPTQKMVSKDVVRFAQWGYRPMIYTEFNLEEAIPAAESWKYTVPPDLQIPDGNGGDSGRSAGGSKGLGGSDPAGGGVNSQRGGGSAKSIGISRQEASAALKRAKGLPTSKRPKQN